MKAFKAFIKPFEAPQRSIKIKIQLKFFSSPETIVKRDKLLLTTNAFSLIVCETIFDTTEVQQCPLNHLLCFVLFDTICTIQKTGKTIMVECYF